MINRVYWYVQGRILIAEYSGRVYAGDMEQSFITVRQMIKDEGLPPYVHLIGDSTLRTDLDPSLLNLKTLANITRLDEDKSMFGWVLAVDPNPHPAMRFLIATITQLTRSRYRMFPDLAQAIPFLYDMDTTLPVTSDNLKSHTESL